MGKPRAVVFPPDDEQPPMQIRLVRPHPYYDTPPAREAMDRALRRHLPADHRLVLGFDPAGGLQ